MNNPPAFPNVAIKDPLDRSGMTLRDYFAAKAMQGFISAKAWHPDFKYPSNFNFEAGNTASEAVSVSSYKYADQMLKAREQ